MSADNLRLWNALGRTDPKHTKAFKRAGGFSGTAVKPIYAVQKMTEAFGPCGEGWGMTEPTFQIVPGDNREIAVYCTVGLWHGDRVNLIYGVGGDKVVSYIKPNEQYKRPERWETDDEAFKKAYTDALTNAMKHIGMAADVHMGQFDDSKYVREVTAEFAEGAKGTPANDGGDELGNGKHKGQRLVGPLNVTELKAAMRAFAGELAKIDGLGSLEALLNARKDVLDQCKRDQPDWWSAPDWGAKNRIDAKRKELEAAAEAEAGSQEMDRMVRNIAAG